MRLASLRQVSYSGEPMDWYYEANGATIGPIAKAELQVLRLSGQLTDVTLVWREGLSNWIPYSEAFADSAPVSRSEETRPADLSNPYAPPKTWTDSAQEIDESVLREGDLSLGSVIATSLRLYFRTLPHTILIHLLFWIPLTLVLSYLDYHVFDLTRAVDEMKSTHLTNALDATVGMIVTGAIFYQFVLTWDGAKGGFWRSMGMGFRRWGWLILTRLLVTLLTTVGLLLLIIPGIYLLVRLTFAELCVVAENESASRAMTRSGELVEGQFWRILIYVALVSAVVYTPLFVMVVPFEHLPQINNWVIWGLSLALVEGAFGIYWQSFVFVLYHRLQDRQIQTSESNET